MDTISHKEFSQLIIANSYYEGRWDYFKAVIDIIAEMQPRKVLEL